jgi:hypothetical protein
VFDELQTHARLREVGEPVHAWRTNDHLEDVAARLHRLGGPQQRHECRGIHEPTTEVDDHVGVSVGA